MIPKAPTILTMRDHHTEVVEVKDKHGEGAHELQRVLVMLKSNTTMIMHLTMRLKRTIKTKIMLRKLR